MLQSPATIRGQYPVKVSQYERADLLEKALGSWADHYLFRTDFEGSGNIHFDRSVLGA